MATVRVEPMLALENRSVSSCTPVPQRRRTQQSNGAGHCNERKLACRSRQLSTSGSR